MRRETCLGEVIVGLVVRIGAVVCLIASGGCSFLTLHRELNSLKSVVYYTGTVSETTKTDAPVIVVLYSEKDGEAVPVKFDLIPKGEGVYHILAPGGNYRLLAFQDVNRDFNYEVGEPIAFLEGELINAREDKGEKTSQQIVFGDSNSATVPAIFGEQFAQLVQKITGRIGEVTTLEDSRFDDEMIDKGVYEPMEFYQQAGPRLYMLQAYDPKRMPVIFVHGMWGSPRSFRKMIAGLDQTRFQPWVFYWPTGMPVELSGWALDQDIEYLNYRYGFGHCDLVGYSMGGLVTRTALNIRVREGRPLAVRNYISISTPWGGDPNATSGVEKAPIVVPSWRDMDPSGTYMKTLFDQSWPSRVRYTLFFGYGGEASGSENADGVVLLRSALAPDAQNHASYIYGFDADHNTIVSDPDVIKKLNEVLEMPLENGGAQMSGRVAP
jgi:uncharacterized alpha/beta hydrolase family protein